MKNVAIILATTTLLGFTATTTTVTAQQCTDVAGWVDTSGDGCDWYEGFLGDDDEYYYDDEKGMSRCEAYGSCCFNGGHSASTACCACGGGSLYSQCTDILVNGTVTWQDIDGKFISSTAESQLI